VIFEKKGYEENRIENLKLSGGDTLQIVSLQNRRGAFESLRAPNLDRVGYVEGPKAPAGGKALLKRLDATLRMHTAFNNDGAAATMLLQKADGKADWLHKGDTALFVIRHERASGKMTIRKETEDHHASNPKEIEKLGPDAVVGEGRLWASAKHLEFARLRTHNPAEFSRRALEEKAKRAPNAEETRGNTNVNLSRFYGNKLIRGSNTEPQTGTINTKALSEDGKWDVYFMLTSDSLMEKMTVKQIGEVVNKHLNANIKAGVDPTTDLAMTLARASAEHGGTDDTTIVVKKANNTNFFALVGDSHGEPATTDDAKMRMGYDGKPSCTAGDLVHYALETMRMAMGITPQSLKYSFSEGTQPSIEAPEALKDNPKPGKPKPRRPK
jgi:serine/threonine protein phosphatase PrpC